MANPPSAKAFTQPMDPADVVDFLATLTQGGSDTDLLGIAEGVASFTLIATAEAVAAGLVIGNAGARVPTLTGNQLRFWLSIDSAQHASPLFSGAGVDLAVELTIITDASPSRTKQRTMTVKVAQQ